MSTRSGQTKRQRPQKHQNQTEWKANKFKTDPTTKLLENVTVTNCCEKCTGVIQWKIKSVYFFLNSFLDDSFWEKNFPIPIFLADLLFFRKMATQF